MAATAIKQRLRTIGEWLWQQIVQPNPNEELPPQDGPFELYTIIPMLHGGDLNGYKLERKIAGMQSYKACERIADQMGIVDYYVLRREPEPAATDGVNGHRGRRVRVA